MSLSPIIEIAIALVLVYYILGLIVSFISARILESLETRGQGLEDSLKKLVGEAKLKDLKAQPQIKALAPVRYDGWQGFFSGKLIEKKIEQIPVTNLVDAVFDTFLLVDKVQPYSADELKTILGKLPDSQAKTSLLEMVNQGITNINQLRSKTSMWFSGVISQTAGIYKAHARQWVISLSIVITLLFGVDTIQFSKALWHDAGMRANANALATYYANQDSSSAKVDQLTADLGTLGLQIGWWTAPADMPAKDAGTRPWVQWVLLKLLGLGITGAAVSQGSSFWYDILRQIKGEKAPANKTPQQPAAG